MFYPDVLMIPSLLILLVAVAVTAIVTRDQCTEWLRSARSKNWPVVSGTTETGDLSMTKNNRGRDILTTSLGYSYNLDGNYYSGYHIEQLNREQDVLYGCSEGPRRAGQLCPPETGDISFAGPQWPNVPRSPNSPAPLLGPTLR